MKDSPKEIPPRFAHRMARLIAKTLLGTTALMGGVVAVVYSQFGWFDGPAFCRVFTSQSDGTEPYHGRTGFLVNHSTILFLEPSGSGSTEPPDWLPHTFVVSGKVRFAQRVEILEARYLLGEERIAFWKRHGHHFKEGLKRKELLLIRTAEPMRVKDEFVMKPEGEVDSADNVG